MAVKYLFNIINLLLLFIYIIIFLFILYLEIFRSLILCKTFKLNVFCCLVWLKKNGLVSIELCDHFQTKTDKMFYFSCKF